MGASEDKEKTMAAGGRVGGPEGKEVVSAPRKWELSVSVAGSAPPPRVHEGSHVSSRGKRRAIAGRCLEDRVPEGRGLPWEVSLERDLNVHIGMIVSPRGSLSEASQNEDQEQPMWPAWRRSLGHLAKILVLSY